MHGLTTINIIIKSVGHIKIIRKLIQCPIVLFCGISYWNNLGRALFKVIWFLILWVNLIFSNSFLAHFSVVISCNICIITHHLSNISLGILWLGPENPKKINLNEIN